MGEIAVIRTSDRNAFRACRRKWNWSSHMRENLGPKQNATPLWFGSGFHFVMEDFHGLQRFKDPVEALHCYHAATKKFNPESLPDDADEAMLIGETMLRYYQKWLAARPNTPDTYVLDGVPQVEVNFRVPLPFDQATLDRLGWDGAVYSGTIDRIVYDPKLEMLWVLDYKTARMFNTQHFQIDSQVTTYCWVAQQLYDIPVAGMIYAQHLKKEIKLPRVLNSGKMSTAQNQVTSSLLYAEQMQNVYGSVTDAPEDILAFYKDLRSREDDRQDVFIRHDYLQRSERMCQSEGQKILLEAQDMMNRDLPLYPNPSRDCVNMCSFNSACVSFDDGGHYQDELTLNFTTRPRSYDGWRKFIDWPDQRKPKEQEFNWNNV